MYPTPYDVTDCRRSWKHDEKYILYTRLDPCSLKIRWVNAALSAKTLIILQLCEPDIATSKERKKEKTCKRFG